MHGGAVVGVVGCGNWGSKHVRVLSSFPEVRQVAVIETNQKTRESVLTSFPRARGFEDLASALPHVSAVVVATPPPSHYELALTALRHRKHVLVEKPMTETADEAVLLVNEARRSSCVLMTGHTLIFNPAVKELRSRLSRGNLGRIRSIHAAQFSLGQSAHGADAVWDLAPHSLSVFNHLIGSHPTSVRAWNESACKRTEEIHVELQYGEAGPSGFIHISIGGGRKVRTFTVIGTEKSAVYDDLAESQLKMYRQLPVQGVEEGLEQDDDIVVPDLEPAEPLAEELRHFLAAIRDQSPPESSGRDGMVAVAIMEAIDRSRKNQRPAMVYYPTEAHFEEAWVVRDYASNATNGRDQL